MSKPEETSDVDWAALEAGFGQDGPVYAQEEIAMALLRGIMRSNDAAETPENAFVWDEARHKIPVLRAQNHGNFLNLEIPFQHRTGIAKMIPLGHFSPVRGVYVIYPEVAGEDEAILRGAGQLEREAELQRFEAGERGAERNDYANPVVRDLHKLYYEELNSGELQLKEMLYGYNEDCPEEDRLEMDECTEAAVCWPASGPARRNVLGLRVLGAYRQSNGAKLRVPVHYFDLAKRQQDSGDVPGDFQAEGHMLMASDIPKLESLAQEAVIAEQILSMDHIKFNLRELGAVIPRPVYLK
jgi:hypothetical protein